jgi:catalase
MTAKTLTTLTGAPVSDNQNSKTAGPRGSVLIEDFYLLEKLATFARERIPERVVHAKGAGAYGTFTVTNDITQYTKAKLFSEVGKKTDLFLRFSTVGGEKGSADTARDPRGFAVKFYTEEGNWDLVGNNTPVFFIRDPMKFPDFIHTQKKNPQTNLPDPVAMWDYWSLSPEALHQITILFSDRGTPDGYRHMNGYGSHTFSLINADNQRVWVKFHLKTEQGIRNLTAGQAHKIAGENPDYATHDLFHAIENKKFPQWKVYVQVMTDNQAEQFAFNPFDLTKVWPHGDFPLIEAGVLELNRNPENYFAEVEQAAFSPASIVPGIGFSPDKVLQGRLFSYPDAHRYRVGVNHHNIPVNAPKQCPAHHYNRDGAMRTDDNGGGSVNYEPNSMGGPSQNNAKDDLGLALSGKTGRFDRRDGNDDYAQAGDLYRLMSKDEQSRLVANIVGAMQGVPEAILKKQVEHFAKADKSYGEQIASGLGLG